MANATLLRTLRKRLGLTLKQASALTGVPFHVYYRADAEGVVSAKHETMIEKAYQILLEESKRRQKT